MIISLFWGHKAGSSSAFWANMSSLSRMTNEEKNLSFLSQFLVPQPAQPQWGWHYSGAWEEEVPPSRTWEYWQVWLWWQNKTWCTVCPFFGLAEREHPSCHQVNTRYNQHRTASNSNYHCTRSINPSLEPFHSQIIIQEEQNTEQKSIHQRFVENV